MRYQRLRRLDLDIATGVVEGAVRHLVGIRFDGPGMRWGDRRERLLHLRCILINGQWEQFRDYIAPANRVQIPICGVIVGTCPSAVSRQRSAATD